MFKALEMGSQGHERVKSNKHDSSTTAASKILQNTYITRKSKEILGKTQEPYKKHGSTKAL